MLIYGQSLAELLTSVQERVWEIFQATNLFGTTKIRLARLEEHYALEIGTCDLENAVEEEVEIVGVQEFSEFYRYELEDIVKRLFARLQSSTEA